MRFTAFPNSNHRHFLPQASLSIHIKRDSPTTTVTFHPSLKLPSQPQPNQPNNKMVKDEQLIELAHPEYWNTRYSSEQKPTSDGTKKIENYEWFRTFDVLKPFFEKWLPKPENLKELHILQLGCGNSVRPPLSPFLSLTNPPPIRHIGSKRK